MLDFKGLFPTVTVFIAFIISILCLFAGTHRNFLDGVDLLTLYTPAGIPVGTTGSEAHDFYSIHIMSYCQGTLGTTNPSAGVIRNVTGCSNRTLLSSFDPTQAWPKEILAQGLSWPRVISDDFHALKLTSQVMGVLYCMGVGAMGAAILVRVWATLAPRPGQGLFEFGFFTLGSLSISIASIIATVIAFEFVALINAHGKGSNVSAHYGEKFLGMTWAAVGLLVAGSVACFVNTFVPKRAASASAFEKDIEG
ncbi:Actin cortical patch SUR7/pH-response regulator PalI [Penicillium cf. griseofulvum]|uniref:Actin cortical patch SUR7/pH-response regulator PalI n=1 Tax=Penicillium cf. griseofulvum TaxID=2972120 RepID=A0A9W9JDT8_9EURO|nr:Actin cortical patch SUR7/pH-response regulator PalI [Penicillium cf. griseofulvum]KAJ5445419.1 Actin cortical patch SUR7/pH-response regulator PalI [Penicillium cf. griseofulvum]KAJ5447139.1 Actin cortical patch SUR7/pH-response regulator PalI [Penicillium cf. griseofulvum]